MKMLTNYTGGLRVILKTDGEKIQLEPGESVEVDPKAIVAPLPDLGEPGAAASDDAALIAEIETENVGLKAKVESLTAENASLKAEIEKLKPTKQ